MRAKSKELRDLADAFFVDVLLGKIPVKNPEFQEELEKRIEALILKLSAS